MDLLGPQTRSERVCQMPVSSSSWSSVSSAGAFLGLSPPHLSLDHGRLHVSKRVCPHCDIPASMPSTFGGKQGCISVAQATWPLPLSCRGIIPTASLCPPAPTRTLQSPCCPVLAKGTSQQQVGFLRTHVGGFRAWDGSGEEACNPVIPVHLSGAGWLCTLRSPVMILSQKTLQVLVMISANVWLQGQCMCFLGNC